MEEVKVDKRRHYQGSIVWVVVGIAWANASFAYVASIIGTTLGQPSFNEYMGLATNPNAPGLIGTMTGLYYVGGIFGCVLNALLADRFGRKFTVTTGTVIMIISEACLAGSVNIGMFIAFRFFLGLGAFMLFLSSPLWVTELVPPVGRSILAGIVGLFGVVGYILAAYVGVGFFYYQGSGDAGWRAPLALGCAPPLILLCIMKWLPESPRWLISKDRSEEAMNILEKLHTSKDDPNHEYAKTEFHQMKRQHELARNLPSSWIEMIKRPSYRRRTMIAFVLPVVLYSTGNLVVTTYAASIFADIGYDAGQSLNLLAGLYLAAIAGNLISFLYIDRIPRHIAFTSGVLLTTSILAIETALVATFVGTTNTKGLAAAAAFLFLFLAAFNLFLEGPSQYYISEVFPTHIRAKGMTVNVIGNNICNIFWLELAPTAFAKIGWKYYLVFICLSVVGAALIYFTFPNTLHKPLEEVAKLFGDDDLVAVFQEDLVIDAVKHEVLEYEHEAPRGLTRGV